MSILVELLVEFLFGGIGPSSDRGLVATLAASSVGLTVATVWLIATSDDPIREPVWGVMILAGSILSGAAGLLLSMLHLRRSKSDRTFSALCLTTNLAAISLPIGWWMTW